MLFSIEKNEWLGNIKNDIFAGIVTSVALLPEVIGFALLAGINPMKALFASGVMLFITTFTSGRPGMVSAAAGSMAVVMAGLIKSHGMEYMILATILTGLIQIILGYFRVERLMKFISKTVMLGFVNSLAILIFLAQIRQLPGENKLTYIMVVGTIILMYVMPKFIKSVPPALIIIVAMTILTIIFPENIKKVGDMGNMENIIPSLSFPKVPISLETLKIILPTSIALAMVGLVETLLTIPIVDNMTETKSNSNREVKAQGFANFIVGIFGGQGCCAMIGQAVINIKSGGRNRLSTLISSISIFVLIFGLKNIMINIPSAILIGIMIVVAIETFEWKSLKLIKNLEIMESIIMLSTIGIVIYTDNLALGILTGVILSSLTLMSKMSTIKINRIDEETHEIKGPLFFGTIDKFKNYIEDLEIKNNKLNLDFSRSHILDNSVKEELKKIINNVEKNNIKVELVGTNLEK